MKRSGSVRHVIGKLCQYNGLTVGPIGTLTPGRAAILRLDLVVVDLDVAVRVVRSTFIGSWLTYTTSSIELNSLSVPIACVQGVTSSAQIELDHTINR